VPLHQLNKYLHICILCIIPADNIHNFSPHYSSAYICFSPHYTSAYIRMHHILGRGLVMNVITVVYTPTVLNVTRTNLTTDWFTWRSAMAPRPSTDKSAVYPITAPVLPWRDSWHSWLEELGLCQCPHSAYQPRSSRHHS